MEGGFRRQIYHWAIKNNIADKNHVAIMGASFGGYSTLAGLAFTPDVFCCGVDAFGMSNLETSVNNPTYWAFPAIMWPKLYGDPKTKEGRALLAKNSPITRVRDIKRPLIIFQGENDSRVSKSESTQMVKAMKKNGLPVAYVVYPDEGHGFIREPNNLSYIALTEIFLARCLGGKFEPLHPGELAGSSHKILEGKELFGAQR
ncbi:hypothetical protein AGMMS49949_08260 [Alphaproteobacteria bacterium]|nr:hypothetical protein AGMMS49949_08260 [Alphaproteobacteria bacterium]GHS99347.1 hypothetical protein AGMMS50296_7460 [Alphaproteobacteria bacterium]